MQIPGSWYLVVSFSISWVWYRNWWFLTSVQVLLMLLIQGSHYENQWSGARFSKKNVCGMVGECIVFLNQKWESVLLRIKKKTYNWFLPQKLWFYLSGLVIHLDIYAFISPQINLHTLAVVYFPQGRYSVCLQWCAQWLVYTRVFFSSSFSFSFDHCTQFVGS